MLSTRFWPPTESRIDVGAAPVGQLARPLDEALAGVVDPVVEPELLQAFELLVAGRGRDHGRAGLLRQLDRGHPDATRAGVDQGGLAGLEVAGGEQALLCGPVRDGNARGARRVQAVRDRPGGQSRHGALRRVRPGRVQGDDAVADRAVLDAGTDVGDRARREVPDDVRHGRELRPGAVEQVAALDADRLDVDDHVAVGALGIGDVLVAQNVRTAVLVDHRRFHRGATLLEACLRTSTSRAATTALFARDRRRMAGARVACRRGPRHDRRPARSDELRARPDLKGAL